MTTLEQKQQSAIDLAENWAAHCEEPIKYGFIAGAEWAESYMRWIPVTERLPEKGRRCNFIVDNSFSPYHKMVFGGKYTGNPDSNYPDERDIFSTPGWGTTASRWMYLPEPPVQEDEQK